MFEEYLERAKEKDEKEAKKRRRLADDFTNLLRSTKVRAWYWNVFTRLTWLQRNREGVVWVDFVVLDGAVHVTH